MDFKSVAGEIIEKIGGEENIAGLTHCATRLRFTLKDDGAADENGIKNIRGVLGVARSGGQFQVIIGNEVPAESLCCLFHQIKLLPALVKIHP